MPTRRHVRPTPTALARHAATLGALLVAVALGGCQTTVTTSDGRPMGTPVKAPPKVPDREPARQMAVTVGAKPLDTDGNTYPDTITATVYLFAGRPYERTPIHRDGAFVFSLHPAGQSFDQSEPLARWRIEGEALEQCKTMAILLGYAFRLSLREAGGDEYPRMQVNLTCRFEPLGRGDPVNSSGVYSLEIGRRQSGSAQADG